MKVTLTPYDGRESVTKFNYYICRWMSACSGSCFEIPVRIY